MSQYILILAVVMPENCIDLKLSLFMWTTMNKQKPHNWLKCTQVFAFILDFKWGFKLMKGKALRKHSLHEKTAAPVLLKLFISSNE